MNLQQIFFYSEQVLQVVQEQVVPVFYSNTGTVKTGKGHGKADRIYRSMMDKQNNGWFDGQIGVKTQTEQSRNSYIGVQMDGWIGK